MYSEGQSSSPELNPLLTLTTTKSLPALKSLSTSFHTTNLDYLHKLLSSNVDNLIPIDPQQLYSIIETSTYRRLLEEVNNVRTNQHKLEEINDQLELTNIELKKQVIWGEEIVKTFKSNEKVLMERVRLLEGVVRNRRIKEEEGEEERKKNKVGCERCEIEERRMREEKREIDKIVRKKKVVSKEEETQTEYCKEEIFMKQCEDEGKKRINNEEVDNQITAKVLSEATLLEIVEENLSRFCEQATAELATIAHHYTENRMLIEENGRLQHENNRLKNSIVKVWEERIETFVNKVEGELIEQAVCHEDNKSVGVGREERNGMKNMEESDEGNYAMEIKRLEAKNLELCAKLAEVKLQFRTVDGLMAVDEEIGDDGPVRRLLKLSQRIKEVVKTLLGEIV